MAVYTLVRYEVRPEAREQAERAMHEHASYVRTSLPDVTWTAYRDPDAPSHFVAMIRTEKPGGDAGAAAFEAAIAPLLVGTLETTRCELVTSSDLQRRHRGR